MKVCKGAKGNPCVVTDQPQPDENFYKYPRNKDGLYSYCKKCDRNRYKNYYQNNRDKIIKQTSDYRKENPEVNNKAVKKYYYNNLEFSYKRGKEWRKKNPHKSRQYASKRRAVIKKACPNWLTKIQTKEIDDIFWLAEDLRLVSGENYHVDHIIPLQGKNVCGLHVPWNLQILPSDLNHSKGNKYNVEDTF